MIRAVMDGLRVLLRLLADAAAFGWLLLQPRGVIVAENLFLRKQLAMYRERGMKPRRPDVADRVSSGSFKMLRLEGRPCCGDATNACAVASGRVQAVLAVESEAGQAAGSGGAAGSHPTDGG